LHAHLLRRLDSIPQNGFDDPQRQIIQLFEANIALAAGLPPEKREAASGRPDAIRHDVYS
jgi:hypothetical protein